MIGGKMRGDQYEDHGVALVEMAIGRSL